MPTNTTKDGTQICYKDWGGKQPAVFSHGCPLSSDADAEGRRKKETLKVYKGALHGMCTPRKDRVNEDLLAFIKE